MICSEGSFPPPSDTSGGVYIIDERAARLDRRPAEHWQKHDTLLQHIEGPNACHYPGQQASSIKHPAMAQGNNYWRNLQPHLMTITLHYHVSWLNWRDYLLLVAGDCQWVVSLSFCLCFQLFQCLWETCLVKNWSQCHLDAKQIDLQWLA